MGWIIRTFKWPLKSQWGLALIVLLIPACILTTPGLTIFGYPILTSETPMPTATPSITCLDQPSEDLSGPPCIQGTYHTFYDVTTQVNDHKTQETSANTVINFYLWVVETGKLEGTAHLSYGWRETQKDLQNLACPEQLKLSPYFSWDVNLIGNYNIQPDASVQIQTQALFTQGPSFTVKDPTCSSPDELRSGIQWEGISVRVVNGKLDQQEMLPIPEHSTGRSVKETRVEIRQVSSTGSSR